MHTLQAVMVRGQLPLPSGMQMVGIKILDN